MAETVLTVFDKWKQFLGDRVEQAERVGMSEEMISKVAYHIGDFLADKVDPQNAEERVLKQLWDAGDDDEKKSIAKLMVRMVDKG
ncbi:DUF3243 domain-containing protein [Paenibacillus sp. N1-5-1-14]|uniref:DUF3243 domain-containing protein n=1 Tax=Paenibacillus radicibacter TaxID=2972488 RepID=UPI002158C0B0|nr:DUF3243 domain-containing protein [Paenibacillus radicibacter]MCR8642124.1 DUF3243 domain-containing protein [Paenibacillus radicibacter]